jgi:hypothetical protein
MGKTVKTLARRLAEFGTTEKTRMRALEILFAIEQGKQLRAKRGKTTSESSELSELIDADQPGETSGD